MHLEASPYPCIRSVPIPMHQKRPHTHASEASPYPCIRSVPIPMHQKCPHTHASEASPIPMHQKRPHTHASEASPYPCIRSVPIPSGNDDLAVVMCNSHVCDPQGLPGGTQLRLRGRRQREWQRLSQCSNEQEAYTAITTSIPC